MGEIKEKIKKEGRKGRKGGRKGKMRQLLSIIIIPREKKKT